MKRIDNGAARRWNVAEYFFNDDAGKYIDLVEEAVDHVFCNYDEWSVREAFKRYLRGDPIYFSSGICDTLTGGFGKIDQYGYWEFPMPSNFVDQFYGVKK